MENALDSHPDMRSCASKEISETNAHKDEILLRIILAVPQEVQDTLPSRNAMHGKTLT